MKHKHIDDILIPESRGVRVFNSLFQTSFTTLAETAEFSKHVELDGYRAHVEKCRDCGPWGLCFTGQRLLTVAKLSIIENFQSANAQQSQPADTAKKSANTKSNA
jgi:hypothetical protein